MPTLYQRWVAWMKKHDLSAVVYTEPGGYRVTKYAILYARLVRSPASEKQWSRVLGAK